jgi:hypothetical protein
VKRSGIPPFANSAKDGAPDPLWLGKTVFFDRAQRSVEICGSAVLSWKCFSTE